jgi:hypothetical protein
MQPFPNGWYRCVMVYTTSATQPATSNVLDISLVTSTGSHGYAGTGNVLIWGAQLEKSSTPTDYLPTTDRLNMPRLTYPIGGGCPSLLLEPQRTNLLTYSNDFTDASWGKVGITAVLGTQVNPEGIASTYNITNTVLGDSYLEKQGLSTTVGNYTMSIFVKNIDNLVTTRLMAVHLATGSVTSQLTYTWATNSFVISGTNAISGSIVSYNNDWVKLSFTYNIDAGVTNHWNRFYGNEQSSLTSKSVLAYGMQCEQGSYPTSYIPTTSAAVTRLADTASKAAISSLIGQTEGTIYAEIKVTQLLGALSRYIFHISDGTANNRIYMAFSGASSNILRGRIFNGGALQCSIDSSTITTTGTYKLALAYKNNDIVFYVNGVQIGVDTSATIPTCSKVDVGSNYAGASQLSDGVSNAILYKTRLTNSQLAALTTI